MAEDETELEEVSEDPIQQEADSSGVESAAERAVDASDIGPSVVVDDDEEGCP